MDTPPPPRKRNRGLWLAVCLLGILLFVSSILNIVLLSQSVMRMGRGALGTGPKDEFPALKEEWSYGSGDAKVARIPVEGVIFRESGGLFAQPHDKVEHVLRQIRTARQDPAIRALILEVNSPGGAITPSDEIYQAVMDFKASQEGRKVVIHMKDLAASGAYYIAVAGDWLIAQPTTIVGSIGVIMQALNWKELADKIGLQATTVVSGKNKDLLNPFEEVPPEQVGLLQEMIDAMYGRFVGLVEQSRHLDPETLSVLGDGRIMTAEHALRHHLIDEIGYWEDVVARTASLLGEPSVRIVRYTYTPDLFAWLMGAQRVFTPAAWREVGIPRLLYLWNP